MPPTTRSFITRSLAAFAVSCLALAACTPRAEPGRVATAAPKDTVAGDTPTTEPIEAAPAIALVPPPIQAASVLTLTVQQLPVLSSGHYEGWAIFADGPLSTGKFVATADHLLVSLSGARITAFPLARDIAGAARVAVTIEEEGDRDPAPSGVTILDGELLGGRARLAFPARLEGVRGSFILATPTDDDPNNETAGAWFATPGPRAAALAVPPPPPNWAYEAWAVQADGTLTMGRFAASGGRDSAAPFSGPRPGLEVPGEDFFERLPRAVRGPVNLADGRWSVSVSLEPDRAGTDPTGPAPLGVVVLQGRIPQGALPGAAIPLEADPAGLPAAVATVG